VREIQLETAHGTIFAAYENEIAAPKAAVCIVHGVGEHFTRYQEMADQLGEHGYNVYGLDLLGHGNSPGSQGYSGTREEIGSLITTLLRHSRERTLGAPQFLFGHSMGGLLVLSYRHYFPDCGVVGFATSSPWLGLTHSYDENDKEEFRGLIAEDELAVHNTAISPKKLFTLEQGRKIPKDDTMHPYIAYQNLLERLDDIDFAFEKAGEPRAPLYIFAGEDDPICSVENICRFAQMEGKQCAIRVWDGMKHEPWNEPNRRQVVSEFADWMDSVVEHKN
jgi:acylglycerol lipase